MAEQSDRCDKPLDSRLEQLSDAQLQCLVLVAENLTSKEIAVRLGISSHTVDERLKRSMKALGVASRRDAGRIVANSPSWPNYQQLVYQSSGLSESMTLRHSLAQLADGRVAETSGGFSEQPSFRSSVTRYLPFPTPGREKNQLSIPARLVMIAILAIFIALAFGSLVSAVKAIADLTS